MGSGAKTRDEKGCCPTTNSKQSAGVKLAIGLKSKSKRSPTKEKKMASSSVARSNVTQLALWREKRKKKRCPKTGLFLANQKTPVCNKKILPSYRPPVGYLEDSVPLQQADSDAAPNTFQGLSSSDIAKYVYGGYNCRKYFGRESDIMVLISSSDTSKWLVAVGIKVYYKKEITRVRMENEIREAIQKEHALGYKIFLFVAFLPISSTSRVLQTPNLYGSHMYSHVLLMEIKRNVAKVKCVNLKPESFTSRRGIGTKDQIYFRCGSVTRHIFGSSHPMLQFMRTTDVPNVKNSCVLFALACLEDSIRGKVPWTDVPFGTDCSRYEIIRQRFMYFGHDIGKFEEFE